MGVGVQALLTAAWDKAVLVVRPAKAAPILRLDVGKLKSVLHAVPELRLRVLLIEGCAGNQRVGGKPDPETAAGKDANFRVRKDGEIHVVTPFRMVRIQVMLRVVHGSACIQASGPRARIGGSVAGSRLGSQ
jgi:hypothetical protein